MSHVRTQIRAALVSLFEGVDGLAGRVVSDPTDINDADASPWVEVGLGVETIEPRTLGQMGSGRRMTRQLSVFAEIRTRGKGEAIEAAESMSASLETAAYQAGRLDGLLLGRMTLVAMEPQVPDPTGSLPLHTLRLQWSATYSTSEADPTSAAT